jgi:hypothetical protein
MVPYLVRLLFNQRITEWQHRLDRLGAYLARTLPPLETRGSRRKKKAP